MRGIRARRRTLGPRSTLRNHTFPPFYACYLLRSVKTPTARTTYVGSTPHPPRRLRQHNGEIVGGAYKTKRGRPWIMTLNVFGFPSKLAALQFEWAWQHPHTARHLKRGPDDTAPLFPRNASSYLLRTKVEVLRAMLSVHPYNKWPLRVKLYSSEILKLWQKLDGQPLGLPQGLTVTAELEGADGKSGLMGSGRTGPIDVTDREFTGEHLRKYDRLNAEHGVVPCGVCKAPITLENIDPLTITLCVHSDCVSISHLRCLSSRFLADEAVAASSSQSGPSRRGNSSTAIMSIVPRGGNCPGCTEWTLWGDLVRGCYRRRTGGTAAVEKEANELSEDEELSDRASNSDELEEINMEGLSIAATDDELPPPTLKVTRKKLRSPPKAKTTGQLQTPPKKRGRPPKATPPAAVAPKPRGRPKTKGMGGVTAGKRKVHTTARRLWESDDPDESLEMINLDDI